MVETTSAEALDRLLKGTSQFALVDVREAGEYNSSHIPGSSLIPRRQLEFQMAVAVPVKNTPLVLCVDDGRRVIAAAVTLKELGYRDVSVLDGGMIAWLAAGLPVETGLTGIMAPPTDVVILGVDRNPAEMMNYLRWETALGEKYAARER